MTDDELAYEFIKVLPVKQAMVLRDSSHDYSPQATNEIDLHANAQAQFFDFIRDRYPESQRPESQRPDAIWPETGLVVLVCNILWSSPHTPTKQWIKISDLPQDADEKAVHKEIRRVLNLKKFFKVCDVCGEKQPVGWMEKYVCHSCMGKQGVVF